MKTHQLILLVVLFLASCTAPSMPAATQTFTPELTATQKSIPAPDTVPAIPHILFSNLASTEIFSVGITGDNLRWLTENAPDARDPVWSPDGTRFAYISFPEVPNSFGEIILSDVAGNLTPVFNVIWEGGGGGGGVRNLRWNSDGSRLFYSWGGNLYMINAARGNKPELLVDGEDFTWSADGSKVAYSQYLSSNDNSLTILEIFVKKVNEEQGLRLWGSEEDSIAPLLKHMQWSYDGKMLALMVYYQNADETKLYVVDTDGKVLVDRLILDTPLAGEEGNVDAQLLLRPDWSPDSAKLAFVDDNEIFSWDILSVDPDKIGSGFSNLTNTEFGIERFPVWSPDGNRIAYLSYTSSSQDSSPMSDLYIMNPDGSKQARMTVDKNLSMGSSLIRDDGMIDIGSPLFFDWSPDGTQIVYSSEGEFILDCTMMDCSQGLSNAGIYLLGVATGESKYLTNPDVGGINPMWHPQP